MDTPIPPPSERLLEPASAPAVPPVNDPDPIHDIPWSVSPEMRAAHKAFERDLPQLLRERPGQWVAYLGDKPLGFAKTKEELYQRYLSQGYEEFFVRCIEPYPEFDYISAF
jgi:hypothetical protein